MSYQYDYVKAFQYGLMYKANIDPKSVKINPLPIVNPPILSVTNKNHIKIAIERAYADMANSGALRSKKIQHLKPNLLNNGAFDRWTDIFYNYMTNVLSNQTFDAWHDYTCEKIILDDLNNASNKKATYGMAQKIVNMAFKYLYCFDDANIYYNKFADCHMPLDSFTLKWFYSKVVQKSGNKTTTWSNLKDFEYKNIINLIRGYFANKKPNPPVTILEAEFVIWPEAKDNMEKAKEAKKNNLPYTPQWTY